MRIKTIGAMLALMGSIGVTQATVTVQGWWHYGEIADYYADSSGNNLRFGSAFSRVGSGNAGAGIVPFAVGGPLGTTGFISTNSLYWTPTKADAAGMWGPGATGTTPAYNPPASNYGIEVWALPEWPGTRGGNGAWLFGSGESGGFRLQLTNDVDAGVMAITARHIGNNIQIGDPYVITTNRWTHLAIVNENGTSTFYVNGVAHGAPETGNATTPAGNIFGGSAPGTQPTFAGYLDELRIFTFQAGQFAPSDLLLRPPGPNIIVPPQPATVWSGGAAPFNVVTPWDTSTTYQWRWGGQPVGGATGGRYVASAVTDADNGATVDVIVTLGGLSVTSSAAPLTVVPVNAADVAAYRDAINAETSLVAYFPADSDTGSVLTNTKDGAHNGNIMNAWFDSRTNRAFGQRALSFDPSSSVEIPNNPEFEFSDGSGSIEAAIYLEPGAITDPAIFSVSSDFGSGLYYALMASRDGSSLVYSNDASDRISWPVPQSLIGRRAHVAFVFENGTDITAYVDGQHLGTKTQPSFGSATGASAWIGSVGANVDNSHWLGTIDELSIYSAALPANTIQTHFSKFLYGTNTAAPSIVSQPSGPRNVVAGAAPILEVKAAGTLPLTYRWLANGTAVPGATAPSLTVASGAAGTSTSYVLEVANAFGTTTSQPIVLNFVAPSGSYAAIVAQDRPSSYWRLGETTGSNAVDSAGFNDAVYGGTLTLGAPGAFSTDSDTAVHFTDGNAVAPWSSTLNPSGPFTVEFWAKPDQSGWTGRSVIGNQNRSIGRSGYVIYQALNEPAGGGRWEAHVGDGAGVPLWLYSRTVPQAGQWYHVALVYDGTNTGRIFVNGAEDTDTGISDLSGTILPNSAAPFEIASRSGGNLRYPGTVDDVAFYNYALTPEQLLNHYKVQWAAAQIVQQPLSVTTNEFATITVTGVASGIPNTYQWTQGGNSLTEASNPDGTPHYPNGVTNATLIITQVTPADSGQYRLVVSNPNGGVTSQPAAVTITPDTQPPLVVSVTALGTPNPAGNSPYLVKVQFNERVELSSATAATAYTLSGGATVTSVALADIAQGGVLGADWRTAVLTTSGLTPGQEYTLTVTGVRDQTSGANAMPATTVNFKAPQLIAGAALWDYYYLTTVTATDINSLLGSAIYPAGPMTNSYLTNFDSSLVTGGNLQNTFFGSLGENYGSSISGWITPTQSGNYTFFLSSDDASQLWLSTDANPASAAMIAEEPGCCHGFTEPDQGAPYTSAPQALVAGTSYFIRAVQVEGGGGDYVKVAWRREGDSTPAGSLTPIPGSFISSYAAAPRPQFNAPVLGADGKLTLTWTGTGTLEESTNFQTWTAVPGNPVSGVQVDATTGSKFYRLRQ